MESLTIQDKNLRYRKNPYMSVFVLQGVKFVTRIVLKAQQKENIEFSRIRFYVLL